MGGMLGGDSGSQQQAPQQAPASTSQTVTQNLPAYVQPYAEQAMSRSAALSNQPYQQYGGERIAGLTDQNTAGLNMIQNRAMYGSPEEDLSRGQFDATMAGAYLSPDSNPYLKSNVDAAMGQAASKVNSQFSGSNYGTTANQETMARTLGEVSGQMYGQNYSNEREAQQRMSALYPQYANIDYSNAQQLLGVGDTYRQEKQSGLDMNYNNWLDQQAQPYKNLDVLSSGIRGAMAGGGSSASSYTGSQPNYQTNRTANALGGAMAGGALGSMAGSGYAPYGAAAGGLLGLWG